jgi:hypothetical protein
MQNNKKYKFNIKKRLYESRPWSVSPHCFHHHPKGTRRTFTRLTTSATMGLFWPPAEGNRCDDEGVHQALSVTGYWSLVRVRRVNENVRGSTQVTYPNCQWCKRVTCCSSTIVGWPSWRSAIRGHWHSDPTTPCTFSSRMMNSAPTSKLSTGMKRCKTYSLNVPHDRVDFR